MPLALLLPFFSLVPTPVAGDPTVVVIQLSCFGFHPDVAEVRNGDIVRFEHADACGANPHTVTNSGTTLDAQKDLNKPQPGSPFVGDCFNSVVDLQDFLTPSNAVYELDLDLANAWAVRDQGQSNEHACLGSNSVFLDNETSDFVGVIPFHCQIHGGNQDPGEGMRGALVIRA
jgi:plastocyanin